MYFLVAVFMKTTIGEFPERLIELRTNANKKRQEVADDLNISRASLEYYEKGKRKPDIELLAKIADYYDVSCDFLIFGVTSANLTLHREIGLSNNAIEALIEMKKLADTGTIDIPIDTKNASDEMKMIIAGVKERETRVLEYLSLLLCELSFDKAVEEIGFYVENMRNYTKNFHSKNRDNADFALFKMNKYMVEAAENILSNKEDNQNVNH